MSRTFVEDCQFAGCLPMIQGTQAPNCSTLPTGFPTFPSEWKCRVDSYSKFDGFTMIAVGMNLPYFVLNGVQTPPFCEQLVVVKSWVNCSLAIWLS